ncbi:hypothetical protein [Azospirillum brasilense]|uniref:hypothetical protein n=1 Tax=Azospirillum brasilense TaxID=192 RepID=UPI0013B446A7|nr:hypothetical protein [Azospirillum brasilense]
MGTAERDADPLVNPVFNPAGRRTGPDRGRNRSMECGMKKLRLSDSARHEKGRFMSTERSATHSGPPRIFKPLCNRPRHDRFVKYSF